MNITYKKLRREDSGLYREIRLECLLKFPERFGSTFEEQSNIEKLAFEIYIEECSDSHFIIGAFHSNELIGICGFYQQSEDIQKGEIIQMYVKPQFQGNGIGMQLLNAAIQKAFKIAELKRIELGVMSSGTDSLVEFYKKAGFEIYDIMKNKIVKNNTSYHIISLFRDLK